MKSYKTLEAGRGYLANFGDLDPEAISQDELDRAEAWAAGVIDEVFARAGYDVSGWEADTPPAVADIAEELAAAKAWQFKFMREGLPAPPDLEDPARRRMRRLARSGLLDSSGARIASASPSVPRIGGPA